MISVEELNPHGYALTPEQDSNLTFLYSAINEIRTAYGHPMIVTSGVRSQADQKRINPTQPNDAHTKAAACDIEDRDGALWAWLMKNLPLLESLDLYLEDMNHTPTWVHFQIYPPASGHRIFIP